MCVRFDWSTTHSATSRIRRLVDSCAMGDCCHALYLAGIDSTVEWRAWDTATAWDRATKHGRAAHMLEQWPAPEALLCPRHARTWVQSQIDPTIALPREYPTVAELQLNTALYLTTVCPSPDTPVDGSGSSPARSAEGLRDGPRRVAEVCVT